MERDTLGVRRGDCGHMLLCSCALVSLCPFALVCLSACLRDTAWRVEAKYIV